MNNDHLGSVQAMLVPTLTVSNGLQAIAFYQKALGALLVMSNTDAEGSVVAEMQIQGARFVVADESVEHGNFSPERLNGSPVRIGLQVKDPDAVFDLAVQAGATLIYAVADQDYGYRLGHFVDPFGHHWEVFRPLQ